MRKETYLPIGIGLIWIFIIAMMTMSSLVSFRTNPFLNKSFLLLFLLILIIFTIPVLLNKLGLRKPYLWLMTFLCGSVICAATILTFILLFFATWGHLIFVFTTIALLALSFFLSVHWILVNLNMPIKNEKFVALMTATQHHS